MNSEPSSQTPTKSGESDASSQNEDRVDGRRFMASLLSLCLIGVVAGALTAGLLTALLFYSPSSVFPSTNDSTADPLACTTNDCKYLAQWLRVKIDRKVDPCHDFYKFVCDDYKDYNSLNKVTFEVMRIAQSAAHATTVPATGQTAWQKATALFKACLTMVDSKRDETKELTEWMTSLGLDLRNLTSSEPFDPVDMVVRCSLDFGIPVLLSFTFENVTFVNKKRLMILNINIDEAKWLEYLQEALKTSEEDINASTMKTLQKYGVPRSRLQGLSSDINKYGTKP
ncbi:uncharacterized protein LOC119444926 [Dermacentor silvarum]|uniref:uncharacterized protein LOC119444926 n=1 Tax=Dermacentor silvarum TaxID=543639 RepID=UPI0021006B9B|nr:uncharacterized protein LOC119444926 [Dermacentor silvarum]